MKERKGEQEEADEGRQDFWILIFAGREKIAKWQGYL